MGLTWMAWTWQTATFFGVIAALLALMTVLEIRHPGGNARDGILGLRTTRGDRLFISLLTAAYVHILWLFFFGMPLTWAAVISLALAAAIWKWV
jgi:predicted small integral membrane protein